MRTSSARKSSLEHPGRSRTTSTFAGAQPLTRASSLLVAGAIAALTIAWVEATVAATALRAEPQEVLQLVALACRSVVSYLLAPVTFVLWTVVLAAFPSRPAWNLARFGLLTCGVGVLVATMYDTLTEYDRFAGYPPFVVAFVGLGFGLVALAMAWERAWNRQVACRWMALVGAGLLVLAIGLHFANYRFEVGRYPTLHLWALQVGVLCLWLGISTLLIRPSGQGPGWMVVLALVTSGLFGGFAGAGRSLDSALASVTPVFVDKTVLGQSKLVFVSFSEPVFQHDREGVLPDPAGPARLRQHWALPELPQEFALEDYNILLIVSETTRYDKTSLFDPGLDSSPHLARLGRSGWVAERAYAPAPGTLHSMSALFAMKLPSMISMTTWKPRWTGELHDREWTAAEALKGSGYESFWIGYNTWFPDNIVGLDQGFDHVDQRGLDDTRIADRAIAELRRHAHGEAPFFGLVFFVSPHADYKSHGYDDLPSKRPADRYLHEIRLVDDQVERLFHTLDELEIRHKTIVVFVGDHGEEFREHGGTRHKSTVYSEVLHVPLVIWVPGVPPQRSKRPTSTMFLFPWLFAHARSAELRRHTEMLAFRYLGPVLRETEGAMVSELIGHDRMRTALIYDDLKINYDFMSGSIEVYRIGTDRLEKHNLFGHDPSLREYAQERVAAYKRLRSAAARYTLADRPKTSK